jgi:hypothetical protein
VRRGLAAALLAAAVAGCAVPPQTADRAACVDLFRQYDLISRLRPLEVYDRRRDRYRIDPVLSRLGVLLIENDCQTRSRDLTGLDAVAAARAGAPVAEVGAPLGRDVVVHVGALTDEADAARAAAFFRSLGLRATSIGDRQLGRRVYVGPVRTEGGLAEVIAIATEAGFVAPYPSEFFRF